MPLLAGGFLLGMVATAFCAYGVLVAVEWRKKLRTPEVVEAGVEIPNPTIEVEVEIPEMVIEAEVEIAPIEVKTEMPHPREQSEWS